MVMVACVYPIQLECSGTGTEREGRGPWGNPQHKGGAAEGRGQSAQPGGLVL